MAGAERLQKILQEAQKELGLPYSKFRMRLCVLMFEFDKSWLQAGDSSGESDGASSDGNQGGQRERPEAVAKINGFFAVAKDNVQKLSSVLEAYPRDVWSKWTNSAGKTLQQMSVEQGSFKTHALMSKALGVKEDPACREQSHRSGARQPLGLGVPGASNGPGQRSTSRQSHSPRPADRRDTQAPPKSPRVASRSPRPVPHAASSSTQPEKVGRTGSTGSGKASPYVRSTCDRSIQRLHENLNDKESLKRASDAADDALDKMATKLRAVNAEREKDEALAKARAAESEAKASQNRIEEAERQIAEAVERASAAEAKAKKAEAAAEEAQRKAEAAEKAAEEADMRSADIAKEAAEKAKEAEKTANAQFHELVASAQDEADGKVREAAAEAEGKVAVLADSLKKEVVTQTVAMGALKALQAARMKSMTTKLAQAQATEERLKKEHDDRMAETAEKMKMAEARRHSTDQKVSDAYFEVAKALERAEKAEAEAKAVRERAAEEVAEAHALALANATAAAAAAASAPDGFSSPRDTAGGAAVTHVVIGNTAEAADGRKFDWTFYVRGAATELISDVTIELHPTFRDPIKELERPDYEYSSTGISTFPIKVFITWNTGEESMFTWDLQFMLPDASLSFEVPQSVIAAHEKM
eukprot:TRINITY_DN36503_c0_g1_i1.p1 TRINITY_DN36503_c0_g1~~TRINITY_DN36503_c0_g1_i1.p1  ORF type:complete len:645 (-),score=201.80 TRINITY_DN36503_c0_g1_i1:59-1993(-)